MCWFSILQSSELKWNFCYAKAMGQSDGPIVMIFISKSIVSISAFNGWSRLFVDIFGFSKEKNAAKNRSRKNLLVKLAKSRKWFSSLVHSYRLGQRFHLSSEIWRKRNDGLCFRLLVWNTFLRRGFACKVTINLIENRGAIFIGEDNKSAISYYCRNTQT